MKRTVTGMKITIVLFCATVLALLAAVPVSAQWQQIPIHNRGVNKIFKADNVLMVTSGNSYLWTTTSEGVSSWSSGPSSLGWSYCFAQDGNTVLMGGSAYLYKSTTNGLGWTQTNFMGDGYVTCLLVNNGRYIAGTQTQGIRVSTNAAYSWTTGTNTDFNQEVTDIVAKGDMLYASYRDGWNEAGSFRTSADNGETWLEPQGTGMKTTIEFAYHWPAISALTVGPDGSMYAAVGAATGDYNGVYVSSDDGETWQKRNNGLGANTRVTALITIGNTLYAGTYSGGVYTTTNGGMDWTALNTGLTNMSVTAFYRSAATLYCGTTTYLYKTDVCDKLKGTATLTASGSTTIEKGETVTLSIGSIYPITGREWFYNNESVGLQIYPTIDANLAGTYHAVLTYAPGCTDETNAVTVIVTKKKPKLTWPAPEAITYGTPLSATQLNATADVPGTFTYTPVLDTKLNAGANQKLNVRFVPDDQETYATIDKEVSITVNKAMQIITLEPITAKVISDGPFDVTATSSSGMPVTLSLSDPSKATLAAGKLTLKSVGSLTVTATQPGNANYSAATLDRTFCINALKPEIFANINVQGEQELTSSSPANNQWYLNGTAINGATAVTLKATQPGKYAVAVVVDGCASERSQTVSIITAVMPEQGGKVIVSYPNPTTGKMLLDLRKLKVNEAVVVSVIDAAGHVIQTARLQGSKEQELDITSLNPGLYVIKVGQQYTIKVQKL